MSLYFNKNLNSELKELTDQLSSFQNFRKNNTIKNLDTNYQTELAKDNENKKKDMIKKKKKKELQNKEVNFFDISLKGLYNNFINTFSNIFSELVSLFYMSFPRFEDDDNRIYKIFTIYLKKIAFILFQAERLVYVGMAFIMASFFVYFILVSK